jgi:peptide/nickel transport system permease protein
VSGEPLKEASAIVSRLRYVLRRLIFAMALVFLVSSGAMILSRLAPGDMATEVIADLGSKAELQRERERLGLTRPLPQAYLLWLGNAARLDFGKSLRYDRPVGSLVAERARNTAVLALAALLAASAIGLPLGVLTGGRTGALAGAIRVLSVAALSLPPFVLSIGLVWLAARSGLLPVGGMTTLSGTSGTSGSALDVLRHLVIPMLALAIPLAATFERLQGRAMVLAIGEPWIIAARARGISEPRLRWAHALRGALAPVVALYGLIAGALLSGSFAVEVVTAWPGLGRLMYEALLSRDVNLVAGCSAAGAAFVAVGTLASDVALAWLDPRASESA